MAVSADGQSTDGCAQIIGIKIIEMVMLDVEEEVGGPVGALRE